MFPLQTTGYACYCRLFRRNCHKRIPCRAAYSIRIAPALPLYTTSNELKAGKATAQVTTNSKGRIELHLQWEWLTSEGAWKSVYVELILDS